MNWFPFQSPKILPKKQFLVSQPPLKSFHQLSTFEIEMKLRRLNFFFYPDFNWGQRTNERFLRFSNFPVQSLLNPWFHRFRAQWLSILFANQLFVTENQLLSDRSQINLLSFPFMPSAELPWQKEIEEQLAIFLSPRPIIEKRSWNSSWAYGIQFHSAADLSR